MAARLKWIRSQTKCRSVIFGVAIGDELTPIWRSLEVTLTDAQRKSVKTGVETLFTEVNDTIRAAADIPRSDRYIEPVTMLRLCQNGFEELFGHAI